MQYNCMVNFARNSVTSVGLLHP